MALLGSAVETNKWNEEEGSMAKLACSSCSKENKAIHRSRRMKRPRAFKIGKTNIESLKLRIYVPADPKLPHRVKQTASNG